MSEWRETTLGQIATVAWGDTTLTKAAYVESGVPAFSASGRDGYLPEAHRKGDGVVVSAIGAQCGKTWFARGEWSCIKNTLWYQPKAGHDGRFLYFLTSNPEAWPKRGAAQPFISLGDAKALRLTIPEPPTQRRISAVLGVIDDLIENHRRRIGLLEQMAQDIYREWFVRFRYPGHEDATFVDSALGPIPEGWRVGTVRDLCQRIQAGGTPRRSEPTYWTDASLDWYKTGDLTDSILIGSSEMISEF